MAEADWTYLNDGLDIATVDRGVTAGIARPPGGGSFLFAFNSLAAVQGAVGLFCNLVDFASMAKGASIRGCVQRWPGGGPTVDCAVDFAGIPTEVPSAGQERWLGIFLKFEAVSGSREATSSSSTRTASIRPSPAGPARGLCR